MDPTSKQFEDKPREAVSIFWDQLISSDLTKHMLQFSFHSLYFMDMPTFSLDLRNDSSAQMPEVHPLLP